MKKIVTALGNQILNENLKNEKEFEILGQDIPYQEGIFEIMEEKNEIDYLILSEILPGENNIEKLIEKIKEKNNNIKIIIILEKRKKELENILYKNGILFVAPSISYEFTDNYAHILISENATNPEEVYNKFIEKVDEFLNNGLNEQDFERIKKMIYGEYIKEYNDISNISRMFLSDFMKGINSFDYLEEIENVNVIYAKQVLKDLFKRKKMVLSVVKK